MPNKNINYGICWDPFEFAWAAGIVDGEGCTMLTTIMDPRFPRAVAHQKLRLQVGQSNDKCVPDMLRRLVWLFGGTIRNSKRHDGSYKRKTIYQWTLHGHERVQYAIACIWKWLTPEKREQAIKAFRSYNSQKHGHKDCHKGTTAYRNKKEAKWLLPMA